MSLLFAILAVLLFMFLCCTLGLYRNECVFRVRMAFIDDDSLYKSGAYDRLPSYEDMLYKPRYWHLWTKQQWIEATP